MTLTLHATPEEVMRAVEALRVFAIDVGATERAVFALMLALEESASNVVNHALARDANQLFEVFFEQQGDRLTVEVRDEGTAFDPTAEAGRNEQAEERVGGWGIGLVRAFVDDLTYERRSDINILRFTKRIRD